MTSQHIMEGNGNRRFVRVVAVETVEVNVLVAVPVEVADLAGASGVVVSTVASLVLATVVMTCMPLSCADVAGGGLD
jgi:hypothetical protein